MQETWNHTSLFRFHFKITWAWSI